MANASMLVIQDDVYSGSLHLDEVLLSAISEAEGGAAAFAFATKNGLSAIFDSEEFAAFCRSGHHFELYLGIDAVTNVETLEYAGELSSKHGGRLIVRVYYDSGHPGIFHPKISWFKNPEGDGCVAFVGSGNLTVAGLQGNIEVFSWMEQDRASFEETLRTWNGWIDAASKAGRVHDVDDPEVLARAEMNAWGRSRSALVRGIDRDDISAEAIDSVPLDDENLIMISCVPRQQGRGWSQFAMAKEYYTDYFEFEVDESTGVPKSTGQRRVLLQSVGEDGTLGNLESRAGNISSTSRNFRMELEAARGVAVLDGDNPVVVFRKTGARSYLYEVFGSDSPWSARLKEFARQHNPDLRGNQLPKCRASITELASIMPALPLLKIEGPWVELDGAGD